MERKKKLGLILGICIPCGVIALTLLPAAIFFTLLSVPFSYKGQYVDLYTTAVCNIFGIEGMSFNGESFFQPQIDIVDRDEYGRTIFIYQEYHTEHNEGSLYRGGLLIMQKSDSKKAYYIDDCYLPIYALGREDVNYKTYFTSEQISTLKAKNDWGNPLKDNYMFSPLCKSQPQSGSLGLGNEDFKAAFQEFANIRYSGKTAFIYETRCCQRDGDGRELFYVRASLESGNKHYDEYIAAMIFEIDKTCPYNHIQIIDDARNSDQIISELKQQVAWAR